MEDCESFKILVKPDGKGGAWLELRRASRAPKRYKFRTVSAMEKSRKMLEERLLASDPPSPTVRQFANLWMDEYIATECNPETYRTYTLTLAATVLPALGEMKLTEITRAVVKAFRDRVEEERGFASMIVAHKTLSAMLGIAERWGFLYENPASEVRRIAV